MSYPFISVVVLTKNNESVIENCMKSLAGLDYPKDRYEIVLVDGHSKDRTVEIVRKFRTRIVYDEGKCKAGGYNVAIKEAHGDYIAFTDADCIVDKQWLKSLLKYFRQDKVAGVGGPNIAPEHAPPIVKAIEFVSLQSPLAVRFDKIGTTVENIAGCNSMYAIGLVKDLFPLPETLAGEEAVLNCRIRKRGFQLLSAPEAVVWHDRHYSGFKAFFRRMFLVGKSTAQIAGLHKELDKPLHKLEGFSVTLGLLLAILLYFLSKPALLIVLGLGVTLLLFLTARCWRETKSFAIARLVPLVAIIEAMGYSLGYMKETFSKNRNYL